jgi:hypothetical protein
VSKTAPSNPPQYGEISFKGGITPAQPSRYGKPPDFEAVRASQQRKALARAYRRPSRRQKYVNVPEDMFPMFARIGGSTTGLLLAVLQWSGTRYAKAADGWVQLPNAVLETAGLSDRRRRWEATKTLVRWHVLETRTAGRGKALEYRLLPVAQWVKG